MNYFLRLIRFNNLVMILAIQWLIQFFIVNPIIHIYGINHSINIWALIMISLAFMLIAAGGYVINDYFDQKIDAINKPEKRVVGVKVEPEKAMILHQALTVSGTLLGLALSYWSRSLTLAILFIALPGGLWFYSSSYKRQFLIGNLTVAFITSLSIISIGILNSTFLMKEYGSLINQTPIPSNLLNWTGGFAYFAFMTTWIREIIKDLEDQYGDRELECRTMAIVWGESKTKLFLYFLIAITLVSLFVIEKMWIDFDGTLTFRYIVLGLALPFILLVFLLNKAQSRANYRKASNFTKCIMVIGILYSFIFALLSSQKFGYKLSEIVF